MRPRIAALVAFALVAGTPSSPSAAQQLTAGETEIADGVVAYRPASAPAGPLPVIVILHGAGGYPPNFLQKMEPIADKRGAMLVAPRSLRQTWDLIESLRYGLGASIGPDARRIEDSVATLAKRAEVDRSRVILLGFSDGASVALTLGLANPKLFKSVIALSPGLLAFPERIDRRQKIFIAHGRDDGVLPFANASAIADDVRKAGGNLRFRPFEGRHQIDQAAMAEGLDWALTTAVR